MKKTDPPLPSGTASATGVEGEYRNLFLRHPHPAWVLDRQGLRFLDVNDAAVKEYGWSREEFLTMSAMDVRPPEDVAAAKEALLNLSTSPEGERAGRGGVWRHRRRDGTTMLVEPFWSAVRFQGKDAWIVHLENVTERVTQEERLRDADEKWRSLVEHSTDFIIVLDTSLRVVFVNRPTQDFRPEDLVGHSIFEFAPPGQEERARRIFERVVRNGEAVMYESTGYGPGRTIAQYENRIVPVLRDGRVHLMMILASDITERKRAEDTSKSRALQQEALAALGRKALEPLGFEELLGEAVAGIARVLDAPFVTALDIGGDGNFTVRAGRGLKDGTIGSRMNGPATPDAAALSAGAVIVATDYLDEPRFARGALLESLGAQSGVIAPIRLFEGTWGTIGAHFGRRREFSPEEISFLQSVADVLAATLERERAAGRRAELEGRLAESRRLEAVGRLAGEVAHRFNDLLMVILGFGSLALKSLPARDPLRKHVEEIMRAGESGASLTRGLLRMFDSAATSGEPSHVAAAEGDRAKPGETILLVEDDARVLRVTRSALEDAGYRVLTSSDGAEALHVEAALDGQVHLLVADLMMPMLGGADLAARLRLRRPGLRVLFFSGWSSGSVALGPGTMFLQKPFTSEALVRKVREVIDGPPAEEKR